MNSVAGRQITEAQSKRQALVVLRDQAELADNMGIALVIQTVGFFLLGFLPETLYYLSMILLSLNVMRHAAALNYQVHGAGGSGAAAAAVMTPLSAIPLLNWFVMWSAQSRIDLQAKPLGCRIGGFGVTIEELDRIIRETYIEEYNFPNNIIARVRKIYPHLSKEQVESVLFGLREYFFIVNMRKEWPVSMPSRLLDVAWYGFTRSAGAYEQFCKLSLGQFLSYSAAAAITNPDDIDEGLDRVWRLSCEREDIDPCNTYRLPLLFAIDKQLNILDGVIYQQEIFKQLQRNAGRYYYVRQPFM